MKPSQIVSKIATSNKWIGTLILKITKKKKMKKNELESLFANVTQVLNITRNLNINKESIAIHVSTLKEARIKLDKYQEMYKNQEYMKTLSPVESKCLNENAQKLYGIHNELVKELDYLDLSKQPAFIVNVTNELNHAYLLLEWLSEEIGKSGRTILPHLTSIKVATFDKGKYRNQVDSLYLELEAISHDFYVDHVQPFQMIEGKPCPVLISICNYLIIAVMWFSKERERLTTEALPEHKVIKLPVETVPEELEIKE